MVIAETYSGSGGTYQAQIQVDLSDISLGIEGGIYEYVVWYRIQGNDYSLKERTYASTSTIDVTAGNVYDVVVQYRQIKDLGGIPSVITSVFADSPKASLGVVGDMGATEGHTIDSHSNVNIQSPGADQVLVWDVGTSKWVNDDQTPAAHTIDSHSDTNIAGTDADHILLWDNANSKWINSLMAHSITSGRTVNDHHNQSHSLVSHSSYAHDSLTSRTANNHHAQSHIHGSHGSIGPNDHHNQTHSNSEHTTNYTAQSVFDSHVTNHIHNAVGDNGPKIDHANLSNISSGQHHAQVHDNATHSTNYATKSEFDSHEASLNKHGHDDYMDFTVTIDGIDYLIVNGHFQEYVP